ncbi:MAG TPA: phytanoyl-CoA dioxygenase family protein, partial [Polyangiaceae bacterium]|nr:phytanoyl-CoA dioxygenase family protein [Polyangiaceae bacterium]
AHPAVAEAAASVLGPDVFVRNVDLVIRRPFMSLGCGWHRDSPEPLETLSKMLTVWLGLTPSRPENGCVWFLPDSHRDTGSPRSLWDRRHRRNPELRTGLGHLDLRRAVPNEMGIGELSLHHARTVHGSGFNRSSAWRIGLVIRVFAADADPEQVRANEGLLIRGTPQNPTIRAVDAVRFHWES